jgi:Xaa-Pro aminopeptidase
VTLEGFFAATGGALEVVSAMARLYVGDERTATMLMPTHEARLDALRKELARQDLDGFVIPISDEHLSEYVGAYAQRLAWLTGFGGSAGSAAVLTHKAAMFVDGRYTLQARDQVDADAFALLRHPEDKPADWIATALPGGGRVGFDPWLHTAAEIETLTATLEPKQIALHPAENHVDRAWTDRPPPPAEPIVAHPDALAGRSAAEKRGDIAAALREAGRSAAVLTLLDSIAWLLNIRGGDIAGMPVPRAFAVIGADGRVALFTDPSRCAPDLPAHLGDDVAIAPPEAFGPALDALTGKVAVDKARAPVWVSDRLAAAGVEVDWADDPCLLPKACKNPVEIAGARTAHLRDGAAMVRFLAWLDREAPGSALSELDVVRRLEAFRAQTGELRGLSFDTIAGAGPHGAIVHYRVDAASNRRIVPGELLLVDSGAQYRDGTTDITRTVAVGPAPEEARRPFTLVLKGLIAMSRLRWPPGLAGRETDAVARVALWRAGLDYDHGTGHGVGSYLGVHEGPAGLSRRSAAPLRPGMILSIEPGYYREGGFGIRTENLAVVAEPEMPEGGERAMLGFETLSYVPIDRRLIAPGMLDADERAWLDAYHRETARRILPALTGDDAAWLETACRPL